MTDLKAKSELPQQDPGELRDLTELALKHARQLKNSAAEVRASSHQGLSVNVRKGEVETLEFTRDRGISVTVYRGRCKGSASSGDLRSDSITDCIERATDIARYTQEDRCNGLADAELMATEFHELDLWHPVDVDAQSAIQRAQEIEAAALATDSRISNSEGASLSLGQGQSVYANSHGFSGTHGGTRYGQSCAVIAGEGGAMQRDYWYDSKRVFEELDDAAVTGRTAAERTVARLGAKQVKTCQAPVLFTPDVARSILAHFIGAVSGGALYRKASFLQDSLGQRLFPESIRLQELPFLIRGPASADFDSEGVATRERDIVHEGVLLNYVLNSYAARKLGMRTTGNAGGVRNLRLPAGQHSQAELIADMGRGLVVNEVMGQGVSIVTGDYSRGAAGFWVENGEIQFPVQEVTVAGNLRDMLKNIVGVGSDLDDRSAIQTGSIVIENLTIAGA